MNTVGSLHTLHRRRTHYTLTPSFLNLISYFFYLLLLENIIRRIQWTHVDRAPQENNLSMKKEIQYLPTISFHHSYDITLHDLLFELIHVLSNFLMEEVTIIFIPPLLALVSSVTGFLRLHFLHLEHFQKERIKTP